MKATVIVTLKPTVLDPQGMTIQRSLASLGLTDIMDVRQGKIFDVRLKNGSREQVERLAQEVLTNPEIEEYRIIWEGGAWGHRPLPESKRPLQAVYRNGQAGGPDAKEMP